MTPKTAPTGRTEPMGGKTPTAQADPFWSCPEHGADLVYLNERNNSAGDFEEHWSCPVEGCNFERHIS